MLKSEYVMYGKELVHYNDLKPNSTFPLEVICDSCGDVFISTKYQLERNGHHKCKKCAFANRGRKYLNPGDKYGRLTVIGPGSKAGYSECECECGNTGEFYNYGLTSGKTKSCGCLQKEKASKTMKELTKNQKKENHPNWKGGVTDMRHLMESSKAYKDLKNYNKLLCCARCGSDENIVVCHIVPYSIDPSRFSDPDNLAPLCDRCYKEYISKYGLKSGKKEFDEFINTLIDPLE